ncbi:uncharacterized protein BJ171DRAFT_183228 [Polychytrium aggregatum]|uniref:uncharacterized protein n=1 Tax=Polychytrium aggregatum TaxID=110093 RepID=UPI0022FE9BBE|nr:uncharacterized protein BJ171DRAFT_183228 [Polychytrium aggregatum]KAI9202336.1 hypothetical protein BJ171DRAFT_183228 [Polychytrium aggregatum]
MKAFEAPDANWSSADPAGLSLNGLLATSEPAPSADATDAHKEAVVATSLDEASAAQTKAAAAPSASTSASDSAAHAASRVHIRDFAYAESDPRHWTNNHSHSPGLDSDDDPEYGPADEELFSSDVEEDDVSPGSGAGTGAGTAHILNSSGQPLSKHSIDLKRDIAPMLAHYLNQDSTEHPSDQLDFYCVKAAFEFSKVTEWEMSIKEGNELIVAEIVPRKQPHVPETQTPPTSLEAAKHVDGSANAATAAAIHTPESDTLSAKAPNSTAQPAAAASDLPASTNHSSGLPSAKRDSLRGSEPTNLNTGNNAGQSEERDRWASVDDLDESGMGALVDSGNSVDSQHNILVSSDPSGDSDIQALFPFKEVEFEPEASVIGTKLREFVGYQKAYGEGWLTGVKLTIRGSQARVKIRLLDLGLIPGNYVQKL